MINRLYFIHIQKPCVQFSFFIWWLICSVNLQITFDFYREHASYAVIMLHTVFVHWFIGVLIERRSWNIKRDLFVLVIISPSITQSTAISEYSSWLGWFFFVLIADWGNYAHIINAKYYVYPLITALRFTLGFTHSAHNQRHCIEHRTVDISIVAIVIDDENAFLLLLFHPYAQNANEN